MHLFPNASRYIRPLSLALAAGVALSLAGCASDSETDTNQPSVQANDVTHMGADQFQRRVERAFPTGDRANSIVLLEEVGPAQVHLDRPANFELRVTNLTNQPLRNVSVQSTDSDGFQFTSIKGATTQPADRGLSYNIGELGPKESRTIQATGLATEPRTIDTCYSVAYELPASTMCTSVAVVRPALSITVRSPADVDICQPIDYVYTVTNTGTGVARNVTLQENLPQGLTTTDGQNTVSANIGDIPQGESREVIAHLKAERTGRFHSDVFAASADDRSQPRSTDTAVHAPSLELALHGGTQDYVGKQVAYHATVTNTGDAPARDAMLQLNRTGIGSLMVSGNDNNASSISLGTIAPGASKTIDFMATSDQGGTTDITANASSQCAKPVSQSAQVQFMTIPALLLETVDESDPVRVGDNVVYDIKVTNQGSGPDSNINLTATVPDGEQFVSATGASEGNVEGQTIKFAPIAHLDAKESATWKVTVKAMKPGDVSFKTSVTSDGVKSPAEKTEPTKLY